MPEVQDKGSCDWKALILQTLFMAKRVMQRSRDSIGATVGHVKKK